MTLKRLILLPLFITTLLLSSCGGGIDVDAAIATGVAKELEISRLETSVAGASQVDSSASNSAANSSAGSDSLQETPIPTIAQVSVSTATNCRSGPGASYSQATVVDVNQIVEVIGIPEDPSIKDYVIVKGPGGSGSCWLWLEHADSTDFSEFDLPKIITPPKPTPTSTPKPTKKPAPVFNWTGSWDFRVSGSDISGVAITQNGNSISGAYLDIIFSASLSNNFQRAAGTWQSTLNGASGTFAWELRSGNSDQFTGSVENPSVLDANGVPIVNEWCGARNGAGLPSPCLGP
jgi:hypothetical protein